MDRDAILSLLPELATMREVGAADFQVWGQAAFLRQQDHGARVLLPFAELAGDVYRVRDERMPALEEKMAPLRRRAARLGLPVPEVEVVAVEHLPAVAVFRDQQGAPCFSITDDVRTFHVLRPSREPVRLAGWTFAATIDHAEDGNVLRTSPGLVGNLPLSYRTDPPTCDHCKARRWRSATYVVRSDDGAFARVGSTCLKSYLGDATATQIVAWAEIEQALQDSLVDDWSEGGAIGYAPRAVDPVAFLSAVALVIQRNGWLSRRVARQTDREATADTAWSLLFPPKGTQLKLTRRDITDAHREDADAALGWAQEIASDVESDYLYNIRTVAHRGAWTGAETGLGASILMSYQREQDRLRRMRFATRLPSVPLGAVGTTYGGKARGNLAPVRADVVGVHAFDGRFGLTTLVKMQVAAGENVVSDVIWFATGEASVVIDEELVAARVAAQKTVDKAEATFHALNQARSDVYYGLPEPRPYWPDFIAARAGSPEEAAEAAAQEAAAAARGALDALLERPAHRRVQVGDTVLLSGTVKAVGVSSRTQRTETTLTRCGLVLVVEQADMAAK